MKIAFDVDVLAKQMDINRMVKRHRTCNGFPWVISVIICISSLLFWLPADFLLFTFRNSYALRPAK